MEIVNKEQLLAKYAISLETNDVNMLTLENMPWLDIGDMPITYNPQKREAFQVFLTPCDDEPFSLYVHYDELRMGFSVKDIKRRYPHFRFGEHGIKEEEIVNTVAKASLLLKEYRGKIGKKERIRILVLFVMAVVMLIIAIPVSVVKENFTLLVVFIVLWFFALFSSTYYFKLLSSEVLRQSQFILAVHCRGENNRLYLRRGVELRPGYLAKWIQITVLDLFEHGDAVTLIRKRFLEPNVERAEMQLMRELNEGVYE